MTRKLSRRRSRVRSQRRSPRLSPSVHQQDEHLARIRSLAGRLRECSLSIHKLDGNEVGLRNATTDHVQDMKKALVDKREYLNELCTKHLPY